MARPLSVPRPAALGLLFAVAGALSAVTILKGIQPNDEGLMLQAAARIADGQVPYSDFWWYYPPGQPYLLAGLWELLGPSLLAWRAVRVLADAAVATLAYMLARRGGAPRSLALVAWLASALAMAYPTGPHPFPIALGLALGALLAFERSPVLAGVLTGLCAVWRLEFAAYLGAGIVLAYAVAPGPTRARAILAARFAAVAAGVAAAIYVPVVAAAGLGDSWDLLVRYPIEDFGHYQSLPFPIDYDGPLNTSSVGGFLSDSAENLLLFYLPLALVVGLAAALVARALRFDRGAWPQVAAAVFAAGMTHYLLVRPDSFHTAPLAVMVSVLGAWALTERPPGGRARALWLAPACLVAVTVGYLLLEGADRRLVALREDDERLLLPMADRVRVPHAARVQIHRASQFVRRRVPDGDPIYVATRRSDRVTSGNPLFYVLADRPNPTRYDIQAPGVVTSAPVQREIVRDLECNRPRVVVRWTAEITAAPEPNRAGRLVGARIVDQYLARRYRPAAIFGSYVVLVPRR